ncbi:MAG: NnrU family protein [Pseudomonadota bacterium]
MFELILACAFFLGIHLGISGNPGIRARLVNKWGEKAFIVGFATASLTGLVWMSRAYATANHIDLWGQLLFLKPLAAISVLIAFILVVTGRTAPNPTIVGQGQWLNAGMEPKGIVRITRHPMMWGIVLWALIHLIINGDLASVIFFGALMLLALLGTRSIDAKRRLAYGEAWRTFERSTSNIPFQAILQGRNRLALSEIGWRLPLVGVVLFIVFLFLHPWLFGVSAT